MKTYTEQDLIRLVSIIDNEYRQYTRNNVLGDIILHEFLQNGFKENKEEKTIPLTAGYLLKKLDWEEFCDLTGIDYYAKREGRVIKDDEVFHIPESKAKQFI